LIKIGLIEKRELNEEFFNEVYPGKGLTTEEAFRNTLKEDIQKYWEAQTREVGYEFELPNIFECLLLVYF